MTLGMAREARESAGGAVFLSFATRHKPLADRFREQATSNCSGLVFRDFSEPAADGAWKPQVERLIRSSRTTLCLVGETTWRSEPVNWEIRRSAELGRRVLAVYLEPGALRIPAALAEIGVTPMPWNVHAVLSELAGQGFRGRRHGGGEVVPIRRTRGS